MVNEWANAKLEDVLDYIQPTNYIVSSTEYSDEYKTPVLTAGKSFIIGYTNEENGIFDRLPTIIFDDFTTSIQFVNFKFKVKSSAMKILVPTSSLVDIRYVFYLMKTLRVNTDTHKRFWISIFSQLPIKIAPFQEQRVIADQIEEMFSDIDNAIENLNKAQEQLKVYRQAVLKAAFDGNSSKAGFSRKNWKEMPVDEIGEVVTGNTPSKQEASYYGRAYPLYKPGDLDAGFMTVDSVDGLTEKGIEKARMLPANSILVTCIGATIGKTGLIRRAGASNQQINAIVPKDFMVNEYVYYFCISPKFQEQIKSNASATTLPILNKTKFQRLMFFVPSRDEQLAIVQEIESHFSLCEKLEETIHINLRKAESLRQSILKQAFEGKLTEQWRRKHKDLISGENSAEALLKRIKAEKDALQAKSKGNNKHD